MINRGNWKLVKAYLKYRQEVGQLSERTLEADDSRLRHVLEWADERPFLDAMTIRPTLPDYLKSARKDKPGEQLSPAYTRKIILAAQQFGEWLGAYQNGYKTSLARWLDTLKAPRSPQKENQQHEFVTLEEIQQIAAAPADTLWEQRIKAAAVFLFLSGMRVGAFATLPIKAFDFKQLAVKQWPSLGVKTKNSKAATTYLLPIPDLLAIVEDWDNKVRSILPPEAYWFAHLDSQTGEIIPEFQPVGKHRHSRVRKDLKNWLAAAGLVNHSPHKFRHGFAVYGLKQAQDMQALKAVSMNMMHANISITDGIYARLTEQNVKEQIANLGASHQPQTNELAELFSQLVNHPQFAVIQTLLEQRKK